MMDNKKSDKNNELRNLAGLALRKYAQKGALENSFLLSLMTDTELGNLPESVQADKKALLPLIAQFDGSYLELWTNDEICALRWLPEPLHTRRLEIVEQCNIEKMGADLYGFVLCLIYGHTKASFLDVAERETLDYARRYTKDNDNETVKRIHAEQIAGFLQRRGRDVDTSDVLDAINAPEPCNIIEEDAPLSANETDKPTKKIAKPVKKQVLVPVVATVNQAKVAWGKRF